MSVGKPGPGAGSFAPSPWQRLKGPGPYTFSADLLGDYNITLYTSDLVRKHLGDIQVGSSLPALKLDPPVQYSIYNVVGKEGDITVNTPGRTEPIATLKGLGMAVPNEDEIKGDFKTFADAYKEFVKTYGDVGLTSGQVPTAAQLAKLAAAGRKLSSPKIQAAMQHLSSWARTNCGIASTSP